MIKTNGFRKIFFGSFVGIVLSYVLVIFFLNLWLSWHHPHVDFNIRPQKLSPWQSNALGISGWKHQHFQNLDFLTPMYFEIIKQTQKSIVLGDDDVEMLLSTPRMLNLERYQKSLYQTWHLRSLVERAIFFPLVDKKNLKIIEQQIGSWQTFAFISGNRIWCDLFQSNLHVSIIFDIKKSKADMDEVLKNIISKIVVTNPNDFIKGLKIDKDAKEFLNKSGITSLGQK